VTTSKPAEHGPAWLKARDSYERFLPKNFSFSGKNFVSTLLGSNSRLLTFDLYFACLDYWNIWSIARLPNTGWNCRHLKLDQQRDSEIGQACESTCINYAAEVLIHRLLEYSTFCKYDLDWVDHSLIKVAGSTSRLTFVGPLALWRDLLYGGTPDCQKTARSTVFINALSIPVKEDTWRGLFDPPAVSISGIEIGQTKRHGVTMRALPSDIPSGP
jgi:hypothetical protein